MIILYWRKKKVTSLIVHNLIWLIQFTQLVNLRKQIKYDVVYCALILWNSFLFLFLRKGGGGFFFWGGHNAYSNTNISQFRVKDMSMLYSLFWSVKLLGQVYCFVQWLLHASFKLWDSNVTFQLPFSLWIHLGATWKLSLIACVTFYFWDLCLVAQVPYHVLTSLIWHTSGDALR